MKYIASIAKILIIGVIFCFSFLLLFDENPQHSPAFLLLEKALSLFLFFIGALLYSRWRDGDPLLRAYDRFCFKGMRMRRD